MLVPAIRLLFFASNNGSDNRPRRLRRTRKQAMIGEELDHEAIEEPWLLDLTGVASAG